jgi:bla regulator protein blaR1
MISYVAGVVVKATIVVLLALAAARGARARAAAVRHLLFAAAFGVLLLLPIASLVAPSFRVAVRLPAQSGIAPAALDALGALDQSIAHSTSPAAAVPPPLSSWRPSPSAILTVIWMSGAVLCLVPAIGGLWQLRRLRRTALPWREGAALVDELRSDMGIARGLEVVLHEAAAGPLTCGVITPAIVLPVDACEWTPDHFRRAVIHELEHVRRADWLTQCAARAICAAYWFHPAVWIAWRRLCLEAERAADDAVLRRVEETPAEAAEYADQLVALAARLSGGSRSPVLAMASGHDLAVRVRAVLDTRQWRGRAGVRWVALTGGLASLLIATMSPLRIVAVAQTPAATAQTAAAKFDAATIKPCSADEAPPGPARGGMGGTNASFSPGRMNVPCVTLEQLIYLAYAGAGAPMDKQLENVVPGGASDDRKVRGGPAWVHSQHTKFAVEATAAGASDRYVLVGTMLQSLLEDRFKLKVHRETEDVPMFAMTVAKSGLKITPARPDDCVPFDPNQPMGAPGSKPACGSLTMGSNGPNAVWRFNQFSLRTLAARLSGALGAYVIDRTDVSDEFVFRFEFHPDESTPGIHWTPDADAETKAPQAASIFTALEQQIGVKLEKTRGPRGYLVIDHVEPLAAGR